MKAANNNLPAANAALISLFAAFIAACAWINIPFFPPFTLQTFGVFLCIEILGGKRGFFTVLVYILLGAAGAPVFSNFSGGIGHLFSSSGGYIFGFLFAAAIMWLAKIRFAKSYFMTSIFSIAALLSCYTLGTAWFILISGAKSGSISIAAAIGICILPYLLPDLIKILLALYLGRRIRSIIDLPN